MNSNKITPKSAEVKTSTGIKTVIKHAFNKRSTSPLLDRRPGFVVDQLDMNVAHINDAVLKVEKFKNGEFSSKFKPDSPILKNKKVPKNSKEKKVIIGQFSSIEADRGAKVLVTVNNKSFKCCENCNLI